MTVEYISNSIEYSLRRVEAKSLKPWLPEVKNDSRVGKADRKNGRIILEISKYK